MLAPLPALGLLGFLLNNQALIEYRDRYIQRLEAELAAATPGDTAAERFPSFVRHVVPLVYGPGERWYRIVTGVVWALAAWAVAAGLTIASVWFADFPWTAALTGVIYLIPAAAVSLAGVETLWLNRGARRSPRSWLPRRLKWGWEETFSFDEPPSQWDKRALKHRRQPCEPGPPHEHDRPGAKHD